MKIGWLRRHRKNDEVSPDLAAVGGRDWLAWVEQEDRARAIREAILADVNRGRGRRG